MSLIDRMTNLENNDSHQDKQIDLLFERVRHLERVLMGAAEDDSVDHMQQPTRETVYAKPTR